MPIDIRLTALPAPAGVSLAAHLAEVAGDGEDIAVAFQGAETAGLDPYLGGPAADVLAACGATGEAGEVTPVAMWAGGKARRLLFVGLGDESAADARKAGAALGRRAAPERGMLAAATLGQPAAVVRAFAEGLLLGSYRFSLASAAASRGPSEVRMLVPAGDGEAAAAVTTAREVAGAAGLARDLVNMPSGRKTPAWLAGEAARVAAASGLTARVRSRPSWRPRDSAASSRWARARCSRRASSNWAITRPARAPMPFSWARASRLTAAGSRSSRTRA